jgi:hypothetical protein
VNGNARSLSVSPARCAINETLLALLEILGVKSLYGSASDRVDNFALKVDNFRPESKSSPEAAISSKHPGNRWVRGSSNPIPVPAKGEVS